MSRRFLKNSLWPLVLVLILLSQGCARFQTPAPVSFALPQVTAIPSTESATMVPTLPSTPTPAPVLAEALSPTPTLAPVMVTAVDGDLAIRSGPDEVFDAIDSLHEGESASAIARSVLDGWVQIPIPSQPGKTGWVSIQTKYSSVSGNVLDLPLIRKVEWPTGAYLINCTSHQMWVEPGGTVVPPITDAPNNRVWFPPSPYKIYDMDVNGQPFVMGVYLNANSEVRIQIDGNRQRSYCP